MTDDLWRRDAVESPCTKVCVVDPASRLCIGCLRTIDEIAEWGRMTPAARAAVMAVLPDRTVPRARTRRRDRPARD